LQALQSFHHFSGSLVGECDCHDTVGADAAGLYQVGNAVGNDAGLAAAGSGQYQYRTFYRFKLLVFERD
jgi:hypothetical protein